MIWNKQRDRRPIRTYSNKRPAPTRDEINAAMADYIARGGTIEYIEMTGAERVPDWMGPEEHIAADDFMNGGL